MSGEKKKKTQEMIYIVFAKVPQSDIDSEGFKEWLKNRGEMLREDFKTKKVFIHVLGLTTYLISQRVSTEEIDNVGFGRWFGLRRRELADYFDVVPGNVFIKAV